MRVAPAIVLFCYTCSFREVSSSSATEAAPPALGGVAPFCRASERSPHPPRLGLTAHEPPMTLAAFGYFSNLGMK
ncbi:unnamed protein product, partial [Rangifer tarandus platyrhynchus]